MKDANTIYGLNVLCIIKGTCMTIMKELHRWFVWYSDMTHGPKMSNTVVLIIDNKLVFTFLKFILLNIMLKHSTIQSILIQIYYFNLMRV